MSKAWTPYTRAEQMLFLAILILAAPFLAVGAAILYLLSGAVVRDVRSAVEHRRARRKAQQV